MAERPKFTPLKFKGQKPKDLGEVRKRTYSQLEASDAPTKGGKAIEGTATGEQGQPNKKLHTIIEQKIGKQLNVAITAEKTAAELAFELVQRKRMLDRVDRKLDKTHKEKMLQYNKMLNRMPEHCDIPKIGEKVQKGY